MQTIAQRKSALLKKLWLVLGLCTCCATDSIGLDWARDKLAASKNVVMGIGLAAVAAVAAMTTFRAGYMLGQQKNPKPVGELAGNTIIFLKDGQKIELSTNEQTELTRDMIAEAIRGKGIFAKIEYALIDEIFLNECNFKKIKAVLISAPITRICVGAFRDADNLESVSFAPGSQLKIIESEAFRGCCLLHSITIPASVSSIGSGTPPPINGRYSYYEQGSTFYNCSNLTHVNFEEGSQLQYIGLGTFFRCSSLQSITIPASVNCIMESAFGGCSSLQSITIPASVDCIRDGTFCWCSSLQSITIPANVNNMGDRCFERCSNLTNITFERGNRLQNIGQEAFANCSALQSITIPASVNSIGAACFSGCSSLRRVLNMNKSAVKHISNYCFRGCNALEETPLPQQIESIGTGAFEGAGHRGALVIPANVSKIDAGAFIRSQFTSIAFEEGSQVEKIAEKTFKNCENLESVHLPDQLKSIEHYAFYGAALEAIEIPATTINIAKGALHGSNLLNVKINNMRFPLSSDSRKYLNRIFAYDRNQDPFGSRNWPVPMFHIGDRPLPTSRKFEQQKPPACQEGCTVKFVDSARSMCFQYDKETQNWNEIRGEPA
jgi:hypothetical protein